MTTIIDKDAVTMIHAVNGLEWAGPITSDDHQQTSADFLSSIKANAKELKRKKEAITVPLNAALKEVRAQFKPAEDKLASIEGAIKTALLEYHGDKEAAAAAEIKRIQQYLDAGHTSLQATMSRLAGIDQPQNDLGGAVIKFSPEKVRIIDPNFLPSHYLYEPEVLEALRKVVSRDIKAGQPCPPGAELYRDKIVAGIAG